MTRLVNGPFHGLEVRVESPIFSMGKIEGEDGYAEVYALVDEGQEAVWTGTVRVRRDAA